MHLSFVRVIQIGDKIIKIWETVPRRKYEGVDRQKTVRKTHDSVF